MELVANKSKRMMTELEAQVYNQGERLVPGVSHGMEELVRHASSYELFRQIIVKHMQANNKKTAHVLDLGCGAGWGSAYLARINGVRVTGVDIGVPAIEYAKTYHKNAKTNFFYADILEYVNYMPEYDYIISRNMVEHVPDGINLFTKLKWKEMLLVDVPYKEPEGANLYHLLHMVDETNFKDYENPLFMYQDLEGIVYKTPPQDIYINIMFILCQHKPTISLNDFPSIIPAWQPKNDYEYYDQSQAGKSRWFLGNRLRVHI
jgi:SAM-dependent methyltransferase